MDTRRVVTSHVYPPIPLRQFDWSAMREGSEPPQQIGWGATEEEAIADLLLLEEEFDDRAGRPPASLVSR